MTEALQQQVQLLSELKTLLAQELELVIARDADALLSLVSEKEIVLEKINNNDSLLRAFSMDENGLTEDQLSLMNSGKALLQECQHMTDVNARTVEKNQIRLERLRNVMLASRNKESLTYSAKGKTHGGMLGNSVKA